MEIIVAKTESLVNVALAMNLIISAVCIAKNFLQQKREDEKNKLEREILIQKITELESKVNMLSTDENKR